MEYRKRVMTLLIFIVFSIYVFHSMVQYNKNAYRIYANQGVLDLRDKVWNQQEKYLLSGEWELYDGLLITPEELDNRTEEKTFLTNKIKSINSSIHQRTYRLKLFTKDKENIAFLISEIKAFKLWINKAPVLNYKFDGENLQTRRMNTILIEKEWYRPVSGGYELDIVLEARDRIGYRERPWKILIGSPFALTRTENINLILNTLGIGFYFLIIVYSFSLFRQKRSEDYLLYLGLLGINNIFASLLDSNILTVLPMFNLQPEGWGRLIDLATVFIPMLIFILCNRLFHEPISRKVERVVLGVICTLSIFIAFLPLEIIEVEGNLTLYLVRVLVPFNVLIIISDFLRGKSNSLMLAGGIGFGMAFIFEVAINTGIIPVGIISVYMNTSQCAYLIFTIFVVLVVGNKFAKKFDEVDQLTLELEYINRNLEKIVDEKTSEAQQSYQQILELQEKKHNFLLNISHDLRSPLFVIKGYMEVITSGLVKDKNDIEKYLKRMQIKTEYLSHLIEDLFLIARLEDNKIDFHMEKFNLAELILQVSRDLKVKSADKDFTIIFNAIEEVFYIEGDRHRIQQVLENVIGNSVKYTVDKGNIIISLWKTNDMNVVIQVKDNGVGISKEDLPHIFERYYKGMKRDNDYESTGLGLSIAREIVEKHGGRIWAENEGNRGTNMYIELPEIKE